MISKNSPSSTTITKSGGLRLLLAGLLLSMASVASADRALVGPGLYVFQTRIQSATCGDADRTGFVTSYMGAIDGIPGAAELTLNIMNSQYWPRWTLTLREDGAVVGVSERDDASNRFEVRRERDRFVGTGVRSYSRTQNGRRQLCEVRYEALLRQFDRNVQR